MTSARIFAPTALLLVAGCSHGEEQQGGGEPFRVTYKDGLGVKHAAQFVSGDLPGYLPDAGPPPKGSASDGGFEPAMITRIERSQGVFFQGAADQPLTVHSNETSYSIGMRLDDIGSGYWVVPAGTLDPTTNEYSEEAAVDLSLTIPSYMHHLLVTAFDRDGSAGPIFRDNFCVASRVPDNFNSCYPNREPPKAVISLSWDTNADLDLQVLTPEGLLVDPKNPFTVPRDGGLTAADLANVGTLDRDSNASCRIDGVRRENLVWQNVMPHGLFGIYVNMFASCGQQAARFEVDVYTEVDAGDGGRYLKSFYSQGGELLDISANGGAARGLFVSEFQFQ